MCWFGATHVHEREQCPTAWLFESVEQGRERVLDRRGEIFIEVLFSGMNWGREGIKNVERRLWE